MSELEMTWKDYRAAVAASDLSESSRATYIDMANNFVRWLRGDFDPGSRKAPTGSSRINKDPNIAHRFPPARDLGHQFRALDHSCHRLGVAGELTSAHWRNDTYREKRFDTRRNGAPFDVRRIVTEGGGPSYRSWAIESGDNYAPRRRVRSLLFWQDGTEAA